jgi:hypothetical protein
MVVYERSLYEYGGAWFREWRKWGMNVNINTISQSILGASEERANAISNTRGNGPINRILDEYS